MSKILIGAIIIVIICVLVYQLIQRGKRKQKNLDKIPSSGDKSIFGDFEEHEGKSQSDRKKDM